MEKYPDLDDLRFLRRVLEDKQQELRTLRFVYLKPWPEAEETCDRLYAWVTALIDEREEPRGQAKVTATSGPYFRNGKWYSYPAPALPDWRNDEGWP